MFYINELESAPVRDVFWLFFSLEKSLGVPPHKSRQLQTPFVALVFMTKNLAQLQAVLKTR